MRKSSIEKLTSIIQKGNLAVDNIIGYSYIKDEVANVVKGISEISSEDITVSCLEDYLFRLNILSFAVDVDVFRMSKDEVMFKGLTDFKDALSEAISFFQTLIVPVNNSILEQTT